MQDMRKENTKKALHQAMVGLLKEFSFDEITTKMLAQKAGISRSGFYTHYSDKYQMIDSYQNQFFQELEAIFDKHDYNRKQSFQEVFEFLAKEQLLSALVSANGTREIQMFLITKVRHLINREFGELVHSLSQVERDYYAVYYSSAFFGICQAWIADGKKESPQEMTRLVLKLLPKREDWLVQ